YHRAEVLFKGQGTRPKIPAGEKWQKLEIRRARCAAEHRARRTLPARGARWWRGGLCAQVAIAGIEIKGADIVGAPGAAELHAPLDSRHGVVSLHNSECSLLARE